MVGVVSAAVLAAFGVCEPLKDIIYCVLLVRSMICLVNLVEQTKDIDCQSSATIGEISNQSRAGVAKEVCLPLLAITDNWVGRFQLLDSLEGVFG